jgi:3-phenylpropionate/trans-cinnamate dioxygenase ferredoxin reductase subunit
LLNRAGVGLASPFGAAKTTKRCIEDLFITEKVLKCSLLLGLTRTGEIRVYQSFNHKKNDNGTKKNMTSNSIVIVGGGHSGAQLCASLAELGQGSRIHLVCEEPVLPYQRPPLSKAFFKKAGESAQSIRAASWYEQQGIQVHLGDPVKSVDPDKHIVQLSSGQTLSYAHLVLATGTRARQLPSLPTNLDNVHTLRTAQDANHLRAALESVKRVTFIGGGFIGLELAATLQSLGKHVTVLESQPRLLSRAVSAELSAHVLSTHQAAGLDVRMESQIKGFEFESHRVTRIELANENLEVECVVLGIGAEPEDALARQIGLTCEQGIVVDAHMKTSHSHIWAVGDCTRFPWTNDMTTLRLESVQNANDQARVAAQSIMGQMVSYQPVPWFWSEQGSMRLQMVGLMPQLPHVAKTVRRPFTAPAQPASGENAGFSLFHYQGERLVCVETVNAPMEHMMARKILEQGLSPSPSAVADTATPLKNWLT